MSHYKYSFQNRLNKALSDYNNQKRNLSEGRIDFCCSNKECQRKYNLIPPPGPPKLERQFGGRFVVRDVVQVQCRYCQEKVEYKITIPDWLNEWISESESVDN